MANGEKRDIPQPLLRGMLGGLRSLLGGRIEAPPNIEPGASVDRRLREISDDDGKVVYFRPHAKKFLDALSEEDVAKLQKLIELRPKTVEWIEGKNERELKNLDGAVEFISSSRTAAKVVMWVLGTSVTVVGGIVAMAKYGIDGLAFLRGRP